MYAVIDIETTGGNYRWGRITEIAIFIHNGLEVIEEFSTLINPEIPIPYFITQLTGISDDMVREAPIFAEVADTIAALTKDHIFVAHNSQFDYTFIRHEFRKLGREFDRPTLCTVKASRKVIPHQSSYSLGRLCEQLSIGLDNRHRAGGDAAATVKLLELLLQKDKDNQLAALVAWEHSGSIYNKYLQNTTIEDLPQSPGLLYLIGADDEILYIDSARNIRRKALSHLKNKGGRATVNVREQIKDVAFEETGTYLIAQLQAHEEVLRNKPRLNPKPKVKGQPLKWYILPDLQLDGFFHLKLERQEINGKTSSFKTKKEALQALESLITTFALCAAFTPLSGKQTTCSGSLSSCKGACRQQEAPSDYNKRVDAALQSMEASTNQLIVEKGRNPSEKALIRIENNHSVSWGYLNLQDKAYDTSGMAEQATQVCRSPEATEIALQYLLKNPVQEIINY
ncbi:exonuclease domain-containing protein [Nafulsella turpanensis]|uniref:exonuclease domain-containing protein n=1 Tax=Nafulsella turpanensis TaxID=1265690 RepID=UPI000346752A|nr:exonuclease domain-containing protein [Nafulsella turpanensis]